MPAIFRHNERSWAIDLISYINEMLASLTIQIKRAGGENTISTERQNSMFPDVVIYGDTAQTQILQGWELKLPDTLITNDIFIADAQRKANSLGLNSCFIWNFTYGVLYIKDGNGQFHIAKQWNDTAHIRTRADVDTHRTEWKALIRNIILEINEYLITGEIHSSALSDIISDTVISIIILRNKNILENNLRQAANTNAIIKASLDVWWSETSLEYSADEPNLYSAYSKLIILNWTNRIVFAHLIKRIHNAASDVSRISEDCSPENANEIFEHITSSCDFFNIFTPLEFNTVLPVDTWNDMIELNTFLCNNGIDQIAQTSLQTILESSVSTIKRESAGQFTTPPKLAEILAKITVIDWSKCCIDPCCGTGTISKAILNMKLNNFTPLNAVESSWASDKFNYPLQIANISLTVPEAINVPCRIFKHNALDLTSGECISITNPTNGEQLEIQLPRFGAIVSNLPFVPFENISKVDLQLINQLSSNIARTTGLSLDGRGDLYTYIIFALWNILEDDGRMGLITSNSWLGTSSGHDFYEVLNRFFKVKQLHISGKGRWFQNAQVVTVLLVLEKRNNIGNPEDNETCLFCKWHKSLSELENSNDMSEKLINSALLSREMYPDIIHMNEYSQSQLCQLLNMKISLNSAFHNIHWLTNITDKLIPISNVFKVIRGERRGWDDLFYPAVGHRIEQTYIKRVLKSSRNINTLIAEPDSDAFCCSVPIDELRRMRHTGALNWIQKFVQVRNGTGKLLPSVLSRANMHWYEMDDTASADFCTTMNPDRRLFFARFNEPTFINQRLIGLKSTETYMDNELNHALLNSILGMFYIEAVGFGRGLGALDINKTSLANAYMLNPALVSADNRALILEMFEPILIRDIRSTDEELEQTDRIAFELQVLRAFGIEEYYNQIKSSLLSMQTSRLTNKT